MNDDKIERDYKLLLEVLTSQHPRLTKKKVTMGFDGFVDIITRVIKKKSLDNSPSEYFTSIGDFGEYTLRKHAKSLSFELDEVTTKIGGNMPITANALGRLGATVECIGSFGLPGLHPIFDQMSPNCQLHSFHEPGSSQVLEFDDGKIMLASIGKLNKVKWSYIVDTIGADVFYRCFKESEMFALLNWSELDNSSEIWRGLIRDVLVHMEPRSVKPIGFFDLSDCSKRTPEAVKELLSLLDKFSNYWRVVLSLNLNEAKTLYGLLNWNSGDDKEITELGSAIFNRLKVEKVIIHYSRKAICWTADGTFTRESIFLDHPVLSTGAGDNFNAGFCAGLLTDLSPDASLLLGHATACYYMKNGVSANMNELMAFIKGELVEYNKNKIIY